MLSFNEYTEICEATSGMCVFTFGRINPPTIGHLKLINKISELTRKYDGTGLVFVSHSQDSEKNPLPYPEKVKLLRKIVPSNIKVVKTVSRRLTDVVGEIYRLGFRDIICVVGDDRVEGFSKLIDNNERFNSAKVVSAGARDPEAEDFTSTVSASMARKAVKDGNFDLFKRCSPFDANTTKDLYEKLKKYMKV